MEDDDRTKKQQYLRHEIIEATGELITGQDVFKKFETKDFKAKNSNIPVIVEFKNTSSSVLTYFFMDDEKKKSGLTKLIPASFGTMNTFVSAPWVIEGPQGLIATYTPSMDVKDGEKITVTTDKQFSTTVKKDVSKFINFMAEERQDGDDIEQWEMEE